MSKTIFITWGSSELGKATAKFFQEKDWNKEIEVNKLEIILFPFDGTNLKQINEVVENSIKLGFDVVFNNAGNGLMGAFQATNDEKINKMFELIY